MKNSNKKAVNSWMKIGVTGAILIGAAAIVGSGAFAVWTSSATANAAVNAGAIKIDLTDSNITANGMAPGDTIQDLLPISFAQATNKGNLVTAIQLSVAASNETLGSNPSAINTAGYTDGTGSSLFTGSVSAPLATTLAGVAAPAVAKSSALTYSISTCSVQWVKLAGATTYSCATTPVVTKAAGDDLNLISATAPLVLHPSDFGIAGSPVAFPSDAGDVNLYAMVSITLPDTANNSFTNAGVKLTFNAAVQQRDGIVTGK
jgi:hypothetical protein